jgi:hypothetical protein
MRISRMRTRASTGLLPGDNMRLGCDVVTGGQGFLRAAAKLCLNARPLVAHLGQPELLGPIAPDHDEIDPAGQQIRPRTEALAAKALDAVTHDGTPHLARHHNPEARRQGSSVRSVGAPSLRHHQEHEMRATHPLALLARTEEVTAPAEPPLTPEGVPHPYFL